MWPLIDTGRATTLEPRNSRDPLPTLPSEWSTFPYLPCSVTTIYMNINITSPHHIQDIILVQKKRGGGLLHASGTYHLTSTDSYQLSIAHLVVKDNYF
jgi:hypothetical protein